MMLPGTEATQGTSVASEKGRPLWPRKVQKRALAHCTGSWLPAAHWQRTQGVLTLQAAAAEGLPVGLQGSGLQACLAEGGCQQDAAGWLLLEGSRLGGCPQGNPAKGRGWVSPCPAWRHALLTAPLQQHRTSGAVVWFNNPLTEERITAELPSAGKGCSLTTHSTGLHWHCSNWQGWEHCTHRSRPAAPHLSTQRAPGAPWANSR